MAPAVLMIRPPAVLVLTTRTGASLVYDNGTGLQQGFDFGAAVVVVVLARPIAHPVRVESRKQRGTGESPSAPGVSTQISKI